MKTRIVGAKPRLTWARAGLWNAEGLAGRDRRGCPLAASGIGPRAPGGRERHERSGRRSFGRPIFRCNGFRGSFVLGAAVLQQHGATRRARSPVRWRSGGASVRCTIACRVSCCCGRCFGRTAPVIQYQLLNVRFASQSCARLLNPNPSCSFLQN